MRGVPAFAFFFTPERFPNSTFCVPTLASKFCSAGSTFRSREGLRLDNCQVMLEFPANLPLWA